jgi:phage baseplate assembly protein W
MPVYTVKFPLDVVSKRDTFDVLGENDIAEVVKFNIKSTILTCPGERRSDPEFGACAKRFLFDFNNGQYETLREEIISQVNKYVPYCILDEVSVIASSENENAVNILVRYTIPDIDRQDVFEITISEL